MILPKHNSFCSRLIGVMEYLGIIIKRMCLLLATVMLLHSGSAAGQVDAPNGLKAAYLLSFSKLISWPLNILPVKNANLVFCVAASESFTNELRNYSGKSVQGRRVQVVALGESSDSLGCHIIYVDPLHSVAWFDDSRANFGQLLVGEEEGFIGKGGAINFYSDGEKLRFEISVLAAKKSGLDISSRLLKLAKIVGGVGR
ncbi:MAG: hypothetical protein COA99_04165 [Moraxellaceae bacterium]|nr:MAG: hypothetical protein COA99_04165 [Moraxellaceae bacterium]